MNTATLKHFCSLHATPGDEEEVFDVLLKRWKAQGLDTRQLGRYAVIAEPGERKKADTVLLLAHADSPGFIVQSVLSQTQLEVLALGGVHPTHDAELLLKTSNGKVPAHLKAASEDWTRTMPLTVTLDTPCADVQKGDRLCWAPAWEEHETEIRSPFLDNRIGCALIADWYEANAQRFATMNVILAASAMEEVNGFGANVLANAV